jgi:hypothetical protein
LRLKQIRDLWGVLERSVGNVPYPYAILADDASFTMTWDKGSHHFEIEVSPEGRYGWFYMDRNSADRAGEEDALLGLFAPEMFSYLQRTIA